MVRDKFRLLAIFVRSDIDSLLAFENLEKQFFVDYWDGEQYVQHRDRFLCETDDGFPDVPWRTVL